MEQDRSGGIYLKESKEFPVKRVIGAMVFLFCYEGESV